MKACADGTLPVGIIERVYKGEVVIAATFASFTIWGFVAVLYFILIFSVLWLIDMQGVVFMLS
ncbi:MAG: hypothetical protein ABI155_00390 [Paralcaligenes sp.]